MPNPWHQSRLMRTALIAVVSLTLLVGTAPLAWGTADARKPALRFAALTPVKVKGANFKSREKIRVVLMLNGAKRISQTRASATGGFTVAFSGAEEADRCNSDVWARATGARGSTATAKMPQAMCPPRLGNPAP